MRRARHRSPSCSSGAAPTCADASCRPSIAVLKRQLSSFLLSRQGSKLLFQAKSANLRSCPPNPTFSCSVAACATPDAAGPHPRGPGRKDRPAARLPVATREREGRTPPRRAERPRRGSWHHTADLLTNSPPDRRAELELELLRPRTIRLPGARPAGPQAVGAPRRRGSGAPRRAGAGGLRTRRRPGGRHRERPRANSELRHQMRDRHNYFVDIEKIAAEGLALAGYPGSARSASASSPSW